MGTTIRKRDPAKHMARFYSLRTQATLFGAWGLVREWGRIGSPGTVRVDPVSCLEEAEGKAQRLAALKRRKGYR
jgi:predicted DNA-binding WGR domain protein